MADDLPDWDVRPDWRWTSALRLADRGSRASRHDDAMLRAAIQWLRHRWRCSRRGSTESESISTALAIYVAGGRKRSTIEGLVLARDDDLAIAEETGLPTNTVATYAALFFDVRTHLAASDWITSVIGLLPPKNLDDALIGWVCKRLAYSGGPHLLRFAIAVAYGDSLCDLFGATLALPDRQRVRALGMLLLANECSTSEREVAALSRLRERVEVQFPRSHREGDATRDFINSTDPTADPLKIHDADEDEDSLEIDLRNLDLVGLIKEVRRRAA